MFVSKFEALNQTDNFIDIPSNGVIVDLNRSYGMSGIKDEHASDSSAIHGVVFILD
jgi:hypothetical protein